MALKTFDGGAAICWVNLSRKWEGPLSITSAFAAPADARTAMAAKTAIRIVAPPPVSGLLEA